jgi:D-arabinose 1-dehydrogenase-like Zn-dependent alcohol dehydrogenase
VLAGNVTTERIDFNPGIVILNEISVHGSAGCSRADLIDLFAWTRDGALWPVIDSTLPLDRAAEAHRRLEARDVTGRIVLTP